MKMTLKTVLCIILLGIMTLANGKTGEKSVLPDWQDPEVTERNRIPMSSHFDAGGLKKTLNGVWKFAWYETIDSRVPDFHVVGFDDSLWDEIPVPGLWELNGYGDPLYNNFGFPWQGHYDNNPPFPADEHNYAGQYRKTFTLSDNWKGKDIFLHIGSATSNVRVWVNL